MKNGFAFDEKSEAEPFFMYRKLQKNARVSQAPVFSELGRESEK